MSELQQKLSNRGCVILANYGDDSIALIQWALESAAIKYQREHQLLKVVSIDTGFAASQWEDRVAEARAYVEQSGLETIHLTSQISFQEAVLGRGTFPSPKFQWCSTVLKGLPLLDWLDSVDPGCRYIILSGKRRETLLPPHETLPEWVEKSEHFNDRSLWHPLIEIDIKYRDSLLERAHFKPLGHRSLECDPCVNSCPKTLSQLALQDMQKTKDLEQNLRCPMFAKEDFAGAEHIEEVINAAKQLLDAANDEENDAEKNSKEKPKKSHDNLTLFYRGCGNPFSCGM